MVDFINQMMFAFFALFPILNPPAMAPIFVALTSGVSSQERRQMGLRIGIFAAMLLSCLLVVGGWLLKILGISVPVIGIAGGLLLFHTAWRMLNKEPKISDSERESLSSYSRRHSFFPLTMPLTAGPGSMAITLTLVPEGSILQWTTMFMMLASIAGIIIAGFSIVVFYCYSDRVIQRLGKTGEATLNQISAFILLAIGVQMVWNGIRSLILTIPLTH